MRSQSIIYAEMEAEIAAWMHAGAPDFGAMAMRIAEFQREACAEYGRFWATKPVPRDWREIPAVPVEVFRRVAIRTFPANETVRTFRTSGTTGEGFGEHHFCSVALYREAAVAGWAGAGLPSERLVALVPGSEAAPYSSLSQMAEWIVPPQRFFFGEWERLYAFLREFERPVLFGTALAFLDFFDWLGDRRLTVGEGSLAVETGGYKGSRREMSKVDLYSLFGEKLGLPGHRIWNEYGMTELSSQFYACGATGLHHGPPWARVIVVEPESGREVAEGETGVVQIFDAANLGSVSAIRTGDLAIRRGDAFELLGRDPAALPRGCSRGAEEMLA